MATEPWFLKQYFRDELGHIPNYYHQEVINHLREGDVVLDAGCGSGEFGVLKQYGQPAGKIVGVDISAEALANNQVVDEYMVADLEKIPCEDGIFDLIVCETVCEHLENPQPVFNEFARVLKKGGFLVLRTYNIWHINNAISLALPVKLRDSLKGKLLSVSTEGTFPTYYRCNSQRRLKQLCAGAGLREEKFIAYRDSAAYWNRQSITSFFVLYEKITDHWPLRFAKMNIVGVYSRI